MRTSKTRSKRVLQDLVWIPIVRAVAVTETGQSVDLITALDWSSSFSGTNFERGTLLRMVGWFSVQQTTLGTPADVPRLNAIVHLINDAVTAVADPGNKAALATQDILSMQMWPLQAQAGSLEFNNLLQRWPVEINTKRKMTTQDVIAMTARISADTAAPAATLAFYGRALVNRQ